MDDTALNKIQLKCSSPTRPTISYITPAGMEWGTWTEMVECKSGTFIKSFALKVEPPQGVNR